LVKIALVCYPNGHIAGAFGPYAAEEDDWITKNLLENKIFQNLINRVKVIIVDRGFRLKDQFSKKGIKILQPSFLHGRIQFEKEEVIDSRLVASARTVIETCNSRLKQFRLLQYLYSTKEIPKLMNWVIIASSLVNMNYQLLRGPSRNLETEEFFSDDDGDVDFQLASDYSTESESEESMNSDSEGEIDEKEEMELLKERKLAPKTLPFTFHDIEIVLPEDLKWKKAPKTPAFPPLSLPFLKEVFQTPTTSKSAKSTVERGLLKVNCEGSFSSSTHQVLCFFEELRKKTEISLYCSCKNGKSRCAHQAALFLYILSLQMNQPIQELTKKDNRITKKVSKSLISKRNNH